MWRSGWVWITTLRGRRRPSGRPDLADMGIEIGLDASLEPILPPLMDCAAARPQTTPGTVRPLGTDHRSSFA